MSVNWDTKENDVHYWKVTDAQGKTIRGYHPRYQAIALLVELFSGEAFAIANRYSNMGYRAVRM